MADIASHESSGKYNMCSSNKHIALARLITCIAVTYLVFTCPSAQAQVYNFKCEAYSKTPGNTSNTSGESTAAATNSSDGTCGATLPAGTPAKGSKAAIDNTYLDMCLNKKEVSGTRPQNCMAHKATRAKSPLDYNPWTYISVQQPHYADTPYKPPLADEANMYPDASDPNADIGWCNDSMQPYCADYPKESLALSARHPYLGQYYRGSSNTDLYTSRLSQVDPADTTNSCIPMILPRTGNPDPYDPLWMRAEIDNCANQYILARARFARRAFERQGSLPLVGDKAENLCQPLRLIPVADKDQEYIPSDYIRGAWTKLLVNPNHKMRSSSGILSFAESNSEPIYSNVGVKMWEVTSGGKTYSNKIYPPSQGARPFRCGPESNSPFGQICINGLVEQQVERIFDPSHPFSPRWDFKFNERDMLSPLTFGYGGDILNQVRCAGNNTNRYIKVDIMSWRAKKFWRNMLRRILINTVCYYLVIWVLRCWALCIGNKSGGSSGTQVSGQCCATNWGGRDSTQRIRIKISKWFKITIKFPTRICGKQTIAKLCEDVRKPVVPINTLKMRKSTIHNFPRGIPEGYKFTDYFGIHLPYMRCWDTGSECVTNNDKGDPMKTDGAKVAIVGAGRETQSCRIGGGDGQESKRTSIDFSGKVSWILLLEAFYDVAGSVMPTTPSADKITSGDTTDIDLASLETLDPTGTLGTVNEAVTKAETTVKQYEDQVNAYIDPYKKEANEFLDQTKAGVQDLGKGITQETQGWANGATEYYDENLRETVRNAQAGTKDFVNDTGKYLDETGTSLASSVSGVGNNVADIAGYLGSDKAADAIRSGTDKASGAILDGAIKAGTEVTADKLGERLNTAADKFADQTQTTLENRAKDALAPVTNTVTDIKNQAQGIQNDIKETSSDISQGRKDLLNYANQGAQLAGGINEAIKNNSAAIATSAVNSSEVVEVNAPETPNASNTNKAGGGSTPSVSDVASAAANAATAVVIDTVQDLYNATQMKARMKKTEPITSWSELKLYQARSARETGLNCLAKHELVFKQGTGEDMILGKTGAQYTRLVCDKTGDAQCDSLNLLRLNREKTIPWPSGWRGYAIEPTGNRRFPNSGSGAWGFDWGTTISNVIGSSLIGDIDTGERAEGLINEGEGGLEYALVGDIIIYDEDVTKSRLPYVAYVTETSNMNAGSTGSVDWVKAIAFNHGRFPDACGNTDAWGKGEEYTMYKNSLPYDVEKGLGTLGYHTKYCDDPRLSACIENLWNDVKLYFPGDDYRGLSPNAVYGAVSDLIN